MKHSVVKVRLNNGAEGLVIDVPDATVMCYDFNFRAGDYLSPKGKMDTAHILEHMVLGANKRYKKSSDFSKEFSKNGAYNNASTGKFHMSYEAECADFEAFRILDLLCVAIESPLLLESEFIAEKANVCEELKSRRNNHFSELSLTMGEAMGQCELTYGERAKQLGDINLSDIKKHYQKTHYAGNLRFFIAGNIGNRKNDILARIENMDIKSGGERLALPDEKLKSITNPLNIKNDSVENVFYRWETVQSHVLSDPEDEATGAFFATLMGTMHSRIFGAARERGLVYGINYGQYRTKNNSIWWVAGQVLPQNIDKLFTLISSELKSVANGNFTSQEMADARSYALGSFQKSIQTVSRLLYHYYGKFVFDGEIDDYYKVPAAIKAVTDKKVISMAIQCLQSSNLWGLGFLGATEEIDTNKLNKTIKSTYMK